MRSSIATESLVQRGKSQMFLDIIAAVEKFQAHFIENPTNDGKIIAKYARTSGFNDEMIKIVHKHMGFYLESFTVTSWMYPTGVSGWALPRNVSVTANKGGYTVGEVIAVLASKYDDRTGRFVKNFPVERYLGLAVAISAGLIYMVGKDSTPQIPAEEVAAIIIHEIGHIDHYLRVLFRSSKITVDTCDVLNRSKANLDIAAARRMISEIDERILSPQWQGMYRKVRDYFESSDVDPKSPQFIEALNALATSYRRSQSERIQNLAASGAWDERDRFDKRSLELDSERVADDFAVRHGALAASVSTHRRLDNLDEHKRGELKRGYAEASVLPIALANLANALTSAFDFTLEGDHDGYEGTVRRMTTMVDTYKHAASDPSLPVEIRKDIAEQVAQAEKTIAEYQSPAHRRARAKFKQWLNAAAKGASILALPFEYRLTGDMAALNQATRDISRNSLYYLADKHS